MLTFFTEHIITLIFGLISAGAIAYCKHLSKKFKEYKKLVEEEEAEKVKDLVKETIKPLLEELELDRKKFEAIKDSYRFRLISLCEIYLERGYLSSKEYSSLSEMWKVYHGLGGNS